MYLTSKRSHLKYGGADRCTLGATGTCHSNHRHSSILRLPADPIRTSLGLPCRPHYMWSTASSFLRHLADNDYLPIPSVRRWAFHVDYIICDRLPADPIRTSSGLPCWLHYMRLTALSFLRHLTDNTHNPRDYCDTSQRHLQDQSSRPRRDMRDDSDSNGVQPGGFDSDDGDDNTRFASRPLLNWTKMLGKISSLAQPKWTKSWKRNQWLRLLCQRVVISSSIRICLQRRDFFELDVRSWNLFIHNSTKLFLQMIAKVSGLWVGSTSLSSLVQHRARYMVPFTWSPLLLDSGCAAAKSWLRIFLDFICLEVLKLFSYLFVWMF